MPTSKKLNDLQIIQMPSAVYDSVGNINANGLHVITKDDNDTNLEVYSTQQTNKLIADNKVSSEEINSAISDQIVDLKSKSLDFILYATDWVGNTYTITNPDIKADSDGILNLAANVTNIQYEIAANASMRISSQTDGTVIIVADGNVPSIDIPITLIILGVVGTCDPEYALIDCPAFTGTPTAPTAPVGTNTHQLATTAFVQEAVTHTDSPIFTGNPTAPTPSPGNNSTSIATTEYVQTELDGYAPINSPIFTGTPTASTAVNGTNTNQIATTAFVQNAVNECKSAVLNFVLSADAWVNNTQRITNQKITANGNGFIVFSTGISSDAMAAANEAQITMSAQNEGSITISTNGTTPTVDIPITLIILP